MSGLALMLVASAVAAAQVGGRPTPGNIVMLDYDYGRSAWGMTCLGYDNAGADRYFDRLFGRRMRRIDAWSIATYGNAEMAAERKREFPDGFIMVGGCRVSTGGEAYDPTRDFEQELIGIERRIRMTRGSQG